MTIDRHKNAMKLWVDIFHMRKIAMISLILFSNPAFADDLNANQIQQELVGQTISWWDSAGWIGGNLILMPSGRATISVESPHHATDSGQWSLRGNQICTKWSSMREGGLKCYSIREVAPGHFVTSGGNEFEIISVGV